MNLNRPQHMKTTGYGNEMTRIARRRTTGGHDILICGNLVNVHLAKIVYKCSECFDDLERVNMGLKCVGNPEHRGFIHRDEAQQIKDRQAQNVDALSEVYKIIDGKVVVIKWQS